MNTYEVHYWFNNASHIDVVEAANEGAATDAVSAEKPEADIWGARARAFEYVTNGQKPCADAFGKLVEGDAKWFILVSKPGIQAGGDTRYVNEDGVGLFFYDAVRHYPWSEITSISITPRF